MKKVLFMFVLMAFVSLANANLVTNGDFESGDLTGWGSWGGSPTVVSDNGPSAPGNYAVELKVSGPDSIYQAGTYMPGVGQTMDIQWDWKANSDLDGNGYWGLFRWLGSDGRMITQSSGGWHKGSVSQGQWMTKTNTTPVQPSNAVSWDVTFFKANATQGTFWVDNVSVVPEPATIALLSMGSIAAIRRKK